LEIVRKNFALKALSLALAIVGWAYFRLAGNPIVATSQFQQLSIPITAVNLPIGYVVRFQDHEAVVTVAAKRGDPAVKPEEIRAVLDLANKGAGVYNVPVALVAPDIVVQSLSPASVTLTIERIDNREFPITFHYLGPGAGAIVVKSATIAPGAAVVSGPTSVLASVATIRVDVAIPDQPKTIDEMVRPVGVDAAGAEVTGLSVIPNLVRVEVHFVAGTQSR
jgi:YbbR domain-containing protein